MNPNESDHFRQLLTTFDAHALGEGDEVAGLNVLTSMAITLGNLAREGSGIRLPDWRVIPAGCDLLATGSLTSTMVRDEVVVPVGSCQDNLLSHLDRLLKDDKAEGARAERNLPRRWTLDGGPPANPGENSLLRLMTADPELEPLIESREEEWAEVLGSAPSEHLDDLLRRPRAFIPAASPGVLGQLLTGAHSGLALVAVGLNRASDAANFGDICSALMGLSIPAGPAGESVRARLLVTDPGGVLPVAAKANGDKTTWLARLIWLADGATGPELPSGGAEGIVRLPYLTARFEHAVRRVLANRFDSRNQQSLIYEADFAKDQVRWMKFLKSMERSLPGIRGTARCLFASLVFGLQRLVEADKAPAGFKFYRSGIEALARHLIRRMANARAAILFSEDQARRLHQKRKILDKLAGGPLDTRSIYRPRISAALCRELLSELAEDGCVKALGTEDKWARVDGATLPEDRTRQLALDV